LTRGFSRRGQPLVALILLLGSWVSARAMMWDAAEVASLPPSYLSRPNAAELIASRQPNVSSAELPGTQPLDAGFTPLPRYLPTVGSAARPVSAAPATAAVPHATPRARLAAGPANTVPATFVSLSPSTYSLPPGTASQRTRFIPRGAPPPFTGLAVVQPASGLSAPHYASAPDHPRPSRRWSVDSWFLWRRGEEVPLAGGILTPSYGASQAGVVLRYRVHPDSGMRPTAYLRTTTALNGAGDREAALGLSARPFAQIPLVAAGEARLTSTDSGFVLRPAAFLVTELPPFALPFGLRGEAYGQAGYVGGQFATAFADGQFRADRRLLPIGSGDLRLGGGLWGGAQRGAARLDIGPSLSFGQAVSRSGSLRISADWRFRVVGAAAPASGPAVTLSAGF
jgi:hypothetical protein